MLRIACLAHSYALSSSACSNVFFLRRFFLGFLERSVEIGSLSVLRLSCLSQHQGIPKPFTWARSHRQRRLGEREGDILKFPLGLEYPASNGFGQIFHRRAQQRVLRMKAAVKRLHKDGCLNFSYPSLKLHILGRTRKRRVSLTKRVQGNRNEDLR